MGCRDANPGCITSWKTLPGRIWGEKNPSANMFAVDFHAKGFVRAGRIQSWVTGFATTHITVGRAAVVGVQ